MISFLNPGAGVRVVVAVPALSYGSRNTEEFVGFERLDVRVTEHHVKQTPVTPCFIGQCLNPLRFRRVLLVFWKVKIPRQKQPLRSPWRGRAGRWWKRVNND